MVPSALEIMRKPEIKGFRLSPSGDMYKVKTFKEITKLERNGMFVYESVPGTAVFDLAQDEIR